MSILLMSSLLFACNKKTEDIHPSDTTNTVTSVDTSDPIQVVPAPVAVDPIPTTPQIDSNLPAMDFNQAVLQSLKEMPSGGGYSTSNTASKALMSSTQWSNGELKVLPEKAAPSFCSGATYLVFLKALQKTLSVTPLSDSSVLQRLQVLGQSDGSGIWGRWNSNGPGTARLFYELRMGRNFDDWSDAKPGDFMKIFWSSEIGKNERGHSVIYLGTTRENGQDYVTFWSSNQPGGMGAKKVTKSSIIRVIFSRVEDVTRVSESPSLPAKDKYLADMLLRSSTPSEMASMIDLR